MNRIKQTVLSSNHRELGAKMVAFGGYLMPLKYASITAEHHIVRQKVGVFDVSHMGEFLLKGERSLDLVQKISSNDAARLAVGQAQYTYMPNNTGGVVDDMLVYRLDANTYMLVVNAANIEKDWEWINKYNDMGAELENISESTGLFALQGPLALETLQKFTSVDLTKIKYYRFVKGSVAGIADVIISATGYTGAGGFELYVPNDYAETLWNKLLETVAPIGLGARDTLRLEMGYCLYGHEINANTSPLEAGLGWVTKFNKEFVYSTELRNQKRTGLNRKLVGFEMLEIGIPRQNYLIYNEAGETIGQVTSGGKSPTLNKAIGLGYVKIGWSKPNSIILIGIRQKKIKAVVRALPFIKTNV